MKRERETYLLRFSAPQLAKFAINEGGRPDDA
jgi:hypothetical protein